MKPVAKGATKKFIRISDDKETAILELKNTLERNFTGRIQGVLKTEKGELEIIIEVLNGRIVAAGVEGYVNMDGGLALNTIVNAILEGTGFLEIIELNEEGVNLDLEFNPNAKLSTPTSLELYINRIELRLRQLKRKRELEKEQVEPTTTTPTKREEVSRQTPSRQEGYYGSHTRELGHSRPSEPVRRYEQQPGIPSPQAVPPREEEIPKKAEETGYAKSIPEVKSSTEQIRGEEEKKKVLEEIGLDEEVLEGLVVNVREKPVVIEAIPTGEGSSIRAGTEAPAVERPVAGQPLVEERTETVPVPQPVTPPQQVYTKRVELSPEELLSKLPLSDKIEEYSKTLLSDADKLLLALIETNDILGHGKDKVDTVFNKLIDMSKQREEPLKLSTSTAGKLYYVIAHRGAIVSAFKIDETTEDIELYGRAALIDLFKKLLSEDIEYIISSIKNTYMLANLGLLKKEEMERELEERAEGLFGRLKKIFGGK